MVCRIALAALLLIAGMKLIKKRAHRFFATCDRTRVQCLQYLYFMDAELGLIHLRVPSRAPFRLQFYCTCHWVLVPRDGHSRLARQLAAEGIAFTTADNAFTRIADWQRAQDLADWCLAGPVATCIDRYAAMCCPVLDVFGQTYHWSLMQVEYATDVVLCSAATPGPLHEQLTREAVLSVKAEQIATFLAAR